MNGFPRLETEAFTADVADNRKLGIHRNGYNGIASLIPRGYGNNLFVPSYAGLNYETIGLPGLIPYRDVADGFKFEPRREAMVIESSAPDHVVLVQPETSHAHVSARITFSVEEPHYLHQRIEITAHQRFCEVGEKNTFRSLWASYMHGPPDRHIYMRGSTEGHPHEGWIGLTRADHSAPDYVVSQLPSDRSLTVGEHVEWMQTADQVSVSELSNWNSDHLPGERHTPLTFYYGLCHDFLFLMMFKQPAGMRLAYSPCGGGQQPVWNPAWDYVLFHEDMPLNVPCVWDVCLVVKPFAGREDVLDEVRKYWDAGA